MSVKVVWNGEPEAAFKIAEALDTKQRFTWSCSCGRLFIDDISHEPGAAITLPLKDRAGRP